MMYFLVFLVISFLILIYLKEYKKMLVAVAGIIIPSVILAIMKITAKAPNDLFSGLVLLKTYKHIWQVKYYLIIVKHFLKSVFLNFYIAFTYLLLFISGVSVKYKLQTVFLWLLVVIMSLGYFTVYLLSPHDMDWILRNSVERIILQIYPLFILALSLCMKLGEKDRAN